MNKNEAPGAYTARLLSNVGSEDPWQVISTTARRLRELIAGRSLEELSRTPDSSKWTVVQVLAHLADAEVVAGWRIRSILAWDGVPLQPFDQDAWAETFRYAETDPRESVMLFEVNRASVLALLRRVDRKLYANHGMHAERGQETIEHLVRLYAGHDLNHLRQIEALVAQLPAPAALPLTDHHLRPAVVTGAELDANAAGEAVDPGDHDRATQAVERGGDQGADGQDGVRGRQHDAGRSRPAADGFGQYGRRR